MVLKTFSQNGMGTIVIDDDATDEEIVRVMTIDATEEHGNGSGKTIRSRKKEDTDGSL